MKIYIAITDNSNRQAFLTEETLHYMRSVAEVKMFEGKDKITKEDVLREIDPDTDVYMTLWGSPCLDEDILNAAPSIKLLVHLAGTVVPFVSDEMWERGVRVINGNDHMARGVAEGCIAYMLAAQRDIPRYSEDCKHLHKGKGLGENRGILGRTVGLVSFGAIAKQLVRMLLPFRCRIKAYDILPIPREFTDLGVEPTSLEDIFSTCDIVSIHTAYNEHTHHMVNKRLLSMIRENALLLNTSRGSVIDEPALIEELRTGRFRAFLDVYEQEPPAADNGLFDLPNVYMMPHMGGGNKHLLPARVCELTEIARDYIEGRRLDLPHEVKHKQTAFMTLK